MTIRATILVAAAVAIVAPSLALGQTAPALTRAEVAIRDGRSAEAVALLEPSIRDRSADVVTQLVYTVALIGDRKADAAERQITALRSTPGVTPAQIETLTASLARVKAAAALSSKVLPLTERGDIRAALKVVEETAGTDSGATFVRAYLLTMLGEFDGAAKLLDDDASSARGATAEAFRRGAAATREQKSSFAKVTKDYADLMATHVPYLCVPEGQSFRDADVAPCVRALFLGLQDQANALSRIAPYSQVALSARLVRAIWGADEGDALDTVRKSKLNQPTLILPSFAQSETGDHASGYLVIHDDTQNLQWIDSTSSIWPGVTPPTNYRPAWTSRKPKGSKVPQPQALVPVAKIKTFSQDVDVFHSSNGNDFIKVAVGLKSNDAMLGGVAHGEQFLDVFGELALRAATRTYGKAIAEILSIPADRYSLVSEKPGHKGALFSGIMSMTTASLAAAQGNTAIQAQATSSAVQSFEKRSEALEREKTDSNNWKSVMQSLQLTIDARALQAEVATLLENTVISGTQ